MTALDCVVETFARKIRATGDDPYVTRLWELVIVTQAELADACVHHGVGTAQVDDVLQTLVMGQALVAHKAAYFTCTPLLIHCFGEPRAAR